MLVSALDSFCACLFCVYTLGAESLYGSYLKGEASSADPLLILSSRVDGRRQFAVTRRYCCALLHVCVPLCFTVGHECLGVYPTSLRARTVGSRCWWKRVVVFDVILTTGKQENSQRMWRC